MSGFKYWGGRRWVLLGLTAFSLGLTACQKNTKADVYAVTPSLPKGSLLKEEALPAPPSVVTYDQQGCLGKAPALAKIVAKAPAAPKVLSGELGLWVAQIDPKTLEPIKAVAFNPNGVFPLASTYKQAVLWALLKEFDAGRLSPSERFDVTRANQSLGRYPYDHSTVKDLTVQMIQWSDNTATDILHRRVGLQKVQNIADVLGLCKTRLILPTKDWWVSQAGLSSTFNNTSLWATATGEQRRLLAASIDKDAQTYRYDYLQRQLDRFFEQHYKPADDLKAHNLSTPYEFANMIAHQHLKSGLSPQAEKWQNEVLAKGFGRSMLNLGKKGQVAAFGGKGGNGWQILTYTGYFKTKDGKHMVYAFMQHGCFETYTMPNTRAAFAWINAAIDEVIGKYPTLTPVVAKAKVP